MDEATEIALDQYFKSLCIHVIAYTPVESQKGVNSVSQYVIFNALLAPNRRWENSKNKMKNNKIHVHRIITGQSHEKQGSI